MTNYTNAIGAPVPFQINVGGTGSTSFAAGSVIFSNGTALTEDNANLNWNDANGTFSVMQPSTVLTEQPVVVITSDPSGAHGHGDHLRLAGNPAGGATISRDDGGSNLSFIQITGGDYSLTGGGTIYLNGNNSTESGLPGGVQFTLGVSSASYQMYDNTQSILLFQVNNAGVLQLPLLGANSYIGTDASSNIVVKTAPTGFAWNVVAGTTQTLAANNGYFANNAGVITFTLPVTSAVGDSYQIQNMQGGFSIAQGAGQSIQIGNVATTTGSGGSITSTSLGDWTEIVCNVANIGFVGNFKQGDLDIV